MPTHLFGAQRRLHAIPAMHAYILCMHACTCTVAVTTAPAPPSLPSRDPFSMPYPTLLPSTHTRPPARTHARTHAHTRTHIRTASPTGWLPSSSRAWACSRRQAAAAAAAAAAAPPALPPLPRPRASQWSLPPSAERAYGSRDSGSGGGGGRTHREWLPASGRRKTLCAPPHRRPTLCLPLATWPLCSRQPTLRRAAGAGGLP